MDNHPEQSPEMAPPPHAPDKQELKREVLDFVKLVVWFLIIFLGLRAYVIEGYEVQGESMEPTLANNERILVLKLPHQLGKFSIFSGIDAIHPGDIVVFDSPDAIEKRYVKRVIAMGPKAEESRTVGAQGHEEGIDPAHQVEVVYDLGEVYVNNRKIDEPYLPVAARLSDDKQRISLDPGEYYVLGDNRGVSKDSRSFDAISDRAIIGKAVIRFWPPTRISLLR